MILNNVSLARHYSAYATLFVIDTNVDMEAFDCKRPVCTVCTHLTRSSVAARSVSVTVKNRGKRLYNIAKRDGPASEALVPMPTESTLLKKVFVAADEIG